jgi:glycosyltransferase involved in cell wall biosynthesis
MRLAVTADWLTTYGGAEHVLAELHALYPDAPLYTTVARPAALGPLKEADFRTSRLQRWYTLLRKHQLLLPWMPRAMEEMDLRGFDVVVSSSHAVGKGIIPPPTALHICYCHTPMRYAWEMEDRYLDDFRVRRFLRPLIKRQLARLRRWDLTTAKRVDVFIANSQTTQERIARTYGRESTVIPPPVGERYFDVPLREQSADGSYFLAVGRLVPYKRFDLLIEVANALSLPLVIAGSGQDAARLRGLAGPTVQLKGFVPEHELAELYAGARALLFPQEEDAGIVLLEAQACGTPVIAYRAGGAVDALVDGTTGVFFDAQTPASLRDAVERFSHLQWDRSAIRERVRPLRQSEFRARMLAFIEHAFAEHRAVQAR